jgi:hypothetical protein
MSSLAAFSPVARLLSIVVMPCKHTTRASIRCPCAHNRFAVLTLLWFVPLRQVLPISQSMEEPKKFQPVATWSFTGARLKTANSRLAPDFRFAA